MSELMMGNFADQVNVRRYQQLQRANAVARGLDASSPERPRPVRRANVRNAKGDVSTVALSTWRLHSSVRSRRVRQGWLRCWDAEVDAAGQQDFGGTRLLAQLRMKAGLVASEGPPAA